MSKPKIKLAIADDHKVVVEGYQSLLEKHSGIEILFIAENGKALLQQLKSKTPDVVLLDIEMPLLDGMGALLEIGKHHAQLKVIVVSTFYHRSFIEAYIKAGARAFLSKTCSFKEVEHCILQVQKQGRYYSPHVQDVLNKAEARQAQQAQPAAAGRLNETERRILQLVCTHKTSQQIAQEMKLPKRSVDYYRQRMMQKLHCENVSALVMYAVENKLL